MTATNLNLPAAATTLTNGLRDIKPPVEISNPWMYLLCAIGAMLLAALAFLAWWYFRKRRLEPPPIPVVPPHIRARQKLEQALVLLHQPREFCIAVSDTIRWYLEERFDFRAPERTTEEFLSELKKTDLLTRDQKERLGEFLQRCDLVKFARYEPGEPELRDLHAAAARLVEETEPIPAAPPAVPPGATGAAAPGSVDPQPRADTAAPK